MKITAIKQQVRNPERVSLYIEGKYSVSLTMSQLLEQQLKIGTEIDEPKLAELKKASADGKLRAKAMNWVFLRPRSTKELRDYLRRLSYSGAKSEQRNSLSSDTVQHIIDDFTGRKWVDDEVFAEWWVGRSSRKTKSISFLRSELSLKGIDREVINDLLKENDEMATLAQLVAKLSVKTKYQDKDRLKRFLVSKGFSYSSIVEALADGIDESDG
jgi:regulatory protein